MKIYNIANDRALAQRLASVKAKETVKPTENVPTVHIQGPEEECQEETVESAPAQDPGTEETGKKKVRKYKQK